MTPGEQLVELLRASRHTLIFTGAGISTASGIPDYRGPQGVWNTRRPVEFSQFMSSEQARIEYWTQKSEDWIAHRQRQPNAAHLAITRWYEAGRLLQLVTQNIDGLHRLAGTPNAHLIEVHGTNALVECMSCHETHPAESFYQRFLEHPVPPRCQCGGLQKPATISFGQSLREADLRAAFAAAAQCDLVLALGSTLAVNPAAQIPLTAAERGTPYVICNQGDTEHDGLPGVALRIEGDLLQAFVPAIEQVCSEINALD